MPRYEYRELRPTPEGEDVFRRWLAHLDEEFTRHKEPRLRSELVRDALRTSLANSDHSGPECPPSKPYFSLGRRVLCFRTHIPDKAVQSVRMAHLIHADPSPA